MTTGASTVRAGPAGGPQDTSTSVLVPEMTGEGVFAALCFFKGGMMPSSSTRSIRTFGERHRFIVALKKKMISPRLWPPAGTTSKLFECHPAVYAVYGAVLLFCCFAAKTAAVSGCRKQLLFSAVLPRTQVGALVPWSRFHSQHFRPIN